MKPHLGLLERIEELKQQAPLDSASYYCVTRLGTAEGKISQSCQSQFRGYSETKPRREIRVGSLVDPIKLRNIFDEINEPSVTVNTPDDLYIFVLIGGHAIIEQRLAEKYFADLLAPQPTVFSHTKGHLFTRNAPKEIIQHAPTRKLRMQVLKRDKYRCKVCGRSPENHVDVELHVHHAHPWGSGGVTEEENLITLCGTCHDGLDPHFDLDLFPLIGVNPYTDILRGQIDYATGVRNYRKISVPEYIEVGRAKKSET